MPQKWLKVPTGTPPELERFADDPEGFRDYVKGVVERARGPQEAEVELIEVYFEVGQPMAHVLVKNLDDPISVKAVCRILGAEGYTELLTYDQVETAIGREPAIRSETDSTSSTS